MSKIRQYYLELKEEDEDENYLNSDPEYDKWLDSVEEDNGHYREIESPVY